MLLLFIVLAVGTSHAYGMVTYRVTAIGASISSLLLLHFVDPLVHPQFFERIVDTLIGAGAELGLQLSAAQLGTRRSAPHREKPAGGRCRLCRSGAAARSHAGQRYRLARKKALDAVAQLSGAIRRLADEPNTNRRALASLGELLGANYLLASDLSSMPVLVKLRAKELDAAGADMRHRATARRGWWRC